MVGSFENDNIWGLYVKAIVDGKPEQKLFNCMVFEKGKDDEYIKAIPKGETLIIESNYTDEINPNKTHQRILIL